MPISNETITAITDHFFAAEDQRHPIEPVASFQPNITMVEGYQVQAAVLAEWQQRGYHIVGKKAAATSQTAQAKMQITEPIYGHLLDFQQAASGATLAAGHFIQPYIECELAFIIGQPLTGPGITADDVLAATEAIAPAYDIVDFRTREWQVGLGEALCTNVYTRHFVVGEARVAPDALDLPTLAISLAKNGAEVATATATAGAIMGHPARSIAWIANKLAEHGRRLEAGEIAITGAITKPHPVVPGDRFEAAFAGLGMLAVQFT